MKNFFNTLTSGINSERLLRLPYFLYSLFLIILPLLFAFALVTAMGLGENLLGGNLQEAQDQLRGWFTTPFLIIFALFMLFIIYANLNIMVKRIRDIGLPAWLTTIILIIIGIGISYAFSNKEQAISLLIWLALVLTPSNTFGKN